MANPEVKLFFNGEIRRMSLEPVNGIVHFNSLLQKVTQLYPNVDHLVWKDEDNDSIKIENDDELQEAIAQGSKKGIVHIHVICSKDGKASAAVQQPSADKPDISTEPKLFEKEPEKDPTLHIGITCDGCIGQVKGLRYKCLVCPDFDLCEICESKHLHDEHAMVRIAIPTDKSWRKAFFAVQFPFGQRPCHQRRCHRQFQNMCPAHQCGVHAADKLPEETKPEQVHEQKQNVDEPKVDIPNMTEIGELISVAMQAFGINPIFAEGFKSKERDPNAAVDREAKSREVAALKIEKAFEQLLSMGFTNEGGLLNRLLVQSNGDIIKVLDSLKSMNC